ncbi:hypothetical protein HPG69_011141 [Diceros bicornis minor]|uniref:Uncharacterized protein n=1 Tax=Diceros bicornis minor TaxID=77932 RepID=A0A7J7EGL7_DICBM|nr:hypothetical protein HPG69_011141 [Diceros bicornis minor]
MAKPTFQNERRLLSPEAGTFVNDENPLLHSTEPGQELPRPDTLDTWPHPQGQAGRIGLVVSKQKQKMEMEARRGKQLELIEQAEPPQMSLEAHSQTEREDERPEQTRARLARLQSSSPRDREEGGGCGPDAASASAASTTDDDGHSQMICDLQQQILEQNQLHKQFLEEARKRLREFQRI